jgi:hypothetical protein
MRGTAERYKILNYIHLQLKSPLYFVRKLCTINQKTLSATEIYKNMLRLSTFYHYKLKILWSKVITDVLRSGVGRLPIKGY